MKLCLIPRHLVENAGDPVKARMARECRVFGIPEITPSMNGQFRDLGLVDYDGFEYYASTYDPPSPPDEEDDDDE